MTNPDAALKARLAAYFSHRTADHPTILTEIHARSVERRIELSLDHYVLVCRLKMLWGWHVEIAPRKPYTQPLGVQEYYHLYTGGKKVINHHGYPLIFGSLLEALTYDPVWATVGEALALVPEGWSWLMQPNQQQGIIRAYLTPPVKQIGLTPMVEASAATPAAAILAARLDWEERKEGKRD